MRQIIESANGFEIAQGYRAAFRNGHQRAVLGTWLDLQVRLWLACGYRPIRSKGAP